MTSPFTSFQQLVADVMRYESFGIHRFGSPGADAALEWIANDLATAGLDVSSQYFSVQRQYDLQSCSVAIEKQRVEAFPHWWPPNVPNMDVSAAIEPGGFEYMTLPFDGAAYLNDEHCAKLSEAFARNPKAVFLCIDHPSGELYTYNVNQSGAPWPVPLILVASKDRPKFESAARSKATLQISLSGVYMPNIEGRNVIGRLERGVGKWLVISTPVTSWFTSTCERGSGIAGFLATARWAAYALTNVDLQFVATSGHEIGHGGMSHFLCNEAPPPEATLAWAHFGSSLACLDPIIQTINSSVSLASIVDRHSARVEGMRRVGEHAREGELRNVYDAGYQNFFGMAGEHRLFHTPADSLAALSTERLVSVVSAFSAILESIASTALKSPPLTRMKG